MGPLPYSLPPPGAEPSQKSAAAAVPDAAVAPQRDPSTDSNPLTANTWHDLALVRPMRVSCSIPEADHPLFGGTCAGRGCRL